MWSPSGIPLWYGREVTGWEKQAKPDPARYHWLSGGPTYRETRKEGHIRESGELLELYADGYKQAFQEGMSGYGDSV
jgi:hypothetical protein